MRMAKNLKSTGKKVRAKLPSHLSAKSAAAFADLINKHKAAGPGVFPLKNFTFFLGAGFSKSWADSYPIGSQLFQVPAGDRASLANVERAANSSGTSLRGDLDMESIKQLIYTLDMNQRYPSIRSRYVDDQNISAVKKELSAFFCRRFLSIVGPDWYWFDPNTQKFRVPDPVTRQQRKIQALFSRMFKLIDGSQGFMEGARFNFITTNYDWLLEAIVDSVCDDDEPGLLFLYRGVTPRDISGSQYEVAHEHNLVFNLFKINGGFEIFRGDSCYQFDYLPKTEEQWLDRPPVLMLPSREQDYLSDYFKAIFPKAVRLLNESKVLVLVGYSLPAEDALLRFIIRQFCEDAADGVDKYIFYVDKADEGELIQRLQSVFPFVGTTLRASVYSGDFSDWAADVAQATV